MILLPTGTLYLHVLRNTRKMDILRVRGMMDTTSEFSHTAQRVMSCGFTLSHPPAADEKPGTVRTAACRDPVKEILYAGLLE